jgi:site-specific DNA-methyltransferase (adenine-specific)
MRYLRVRTLLVNGYPKEPFDTIGDVIDRNYSGNKLHPTQKPLSVLLPLVETLSKSSGTVLDPFAGSGFDVVGSETRSIAASRARGWRPVELQ